MGQRVVLRLGLRFRGGQCGFRLVGELFPEQDGEGLGELAADRAVVADVELVVAAEGQVM